MTLKNFFLKSIRFYQKYLAVNYAFARVLFLTDKSCRFLPTCSQYSYEAIARYGIIRGLFLSLKRILRCHPFSKGGYDPLK